MAAYDNRFYLFLLDGLRYKTRSPKSEWYTAYGYSFSYDHIFKWSRKLLPKFYLIFEDDQTYAKNVIFYLDRHKDPLLEKLLKPDALLQLDQKSQNELEEELENDKQELEKLRLERSKKMGATNKKVEVPPPSRAATNKPTVAPPPPAATNKPSNSPLSPTGRVAPGISNEAKSSPVTRKALSSKIPYVVKKFSLDSASTLTIQASKLLNKIPIPTVITTIITTIVGSQIGGSQGAVVGFLAGVPIGTGINHLITAGRDPVYLQPVPQSLGGSYNPGLNRLAQGTRSLASNFAGRIGSRVVQRLILGIAVSPITFWAIVIGIGFLLIFLFMFKFIPEGALFPPFGTSTTQTPQQNQLTITKIAPPEVANGQDINYEISVTFTGTGKADLEILDKIPQGTDFVSASDNGKTESGSIKWLLNGITSGQTKKLSLVVKPNIENVWISNSAEGKILKIDGGETRGDGSIAMCQFTRSGQSRNVASKKLQSYFEEVGAKSGISASVLASVAMHENSGFTTDAQDDHDAFGADIATDTKCLHFATSPTGALGLMQVQPPQSVFPLALAAAHDKAGVERGLAFIDPNRSYDSLTLKDFCDVKTSIAMGAGVLISKNGGKPPTTPGEIQKAGCGYYGTCTYGVYNYGEEIKNDYLACTKTSSSSSSSPTAKLPGSPTETKSSGTPTKCQGAAVSFNANKKLLPLPNEGSCSSTGTKTCGRPGSCVVPRKIVLHTTAGPANAEGTWQFFANGATNRYGVGSHFIIGTDGETIQGVEMLDDKVEIAYAVANYSDHISIEMTYPGVYKSKSEVPAAQYQATVSLVKQLMQQYKIPVGNLEYDWKSTFDGYNASTVPGVYGHYQLNPSNRTDPGAGLMKDMREDLK